ncbi:MAG: hypothetical protein U0359_13690 [Byssovorax sp.]
MRAQAPLASLAMLALAACKPSLPNPFDIAGTTIKTTIMVVDDGARAASRASRSHSRPPPAPPVDAAGAPPAAPPVDAAPPFQQPVPSALPEVVPQSADRLVEARFLGEGGESRWSLSSSGRPLCETPCTLRYPAGTALSLLQLDVPRKPARLDVPYVDPGLYDIAARPRSMGAFAPGVVAAAFGGMGAVVGVVLTPVGCSQNNTSMCEGGLVTLGVSGAVLALGIVLVSTSSPRVTVKELLGAGAPPPAEP